MKKTLLLLLFALSAFGFSVNACEIKVSLHDKQGNGWSGNSLSFTYIDENSVQQNIVYNATTFVNTYLYEEVLNIKNGSEISWEFTGNSTTNLTRWFVLYYNETGATWYESDNPLSPGLNGIAVLDCDEATRPRNINVEATAGGGVNTTGSTIPGQMHTITATPDNGYTFVNWTVNDEIVSLSASYMFIVDKDTDFVAHFIPINGVLVGSGEEDNFYIPTYTYYGFSMSQQIYTTDEVAYGVINSISFYNAGKEYEREYDIYLLNTTKESFDDEDDWLAVSDGDLYFQGTITFEYGTWTKILLDNTFTIEENKNVAVIIADNTDDSEGNATNQQKLRVYNANNGTQALCSYNDDEQYDPSNPEVIEEYELLEVKNQIIFGYSSMSCTVTATSNNTTYGTVTGGGTYNSGETCTLTATAATGYEFKCWKEANTIVSTDAEYTFTVEGDRTLTAYFGTHWTPIEGNQTTATVKGVVSINGQQQVNPDNVLEVGAFCGDECRAVTRPQYFPPTQEYVVQMSVRSNVLSGETITFRLYNYETQEEYDICPNTIEYVAEAIYGGMGNWFQFAFYTELDITTSVNPENAGAVTGAGSYLYGTQATITATPNDGYVFVNWTKNNAEVSTNPSYTFTVEEAAEYVANFNIVISATANPTAGGTVTGAGNYAYGTTCQLVATNNSGYEFVNWTKGGVEVSTEPSYSFTVEAPGAYVANFNPIEFEINAIVNPAEAGTVSGAGMYMVGTNCTLTATANPGYEFVNWTKDNVEVSTNASLSFTVEGAATYYANFTGKQVTQLVNGWNWWSTAIETDNNSLTVLEETLGHNGLTIKSQDLATENYYQDLGYDYWWGALTMLNNESNYLIQTNAACEVVMTGEYVDPAEHPITIVPNWSWIGYPVNATQEVADAISNTFVPADGDMIKSQGASITYYDGYGWWTSEVISMIPGKGYKYQSNASENKSLTFVNNGNSNSKSGSIDNHYWKSNPYAYADNMVIFATAIVANEEQHDADLELGAFVDGVCRGRTHMRYFEPLNRYLALMTVSGEEGDIIEFGLVNANSNLISLDCSDNVVFESDAVVGSLDEPFEVHFSAMQEFSRSQLEMFPNPVSRNETVSFNLPDDEMVKEVVMTNAVGAVVKHNASSLTMIGEGMPMSGVYMVKVVCNSGNVYIGKLIVK